MMVEEEKKVGTKGPETDGPVSFRQMIGQPGPLQNIQADLLKVYGDKSVAQMIKQVKSADGRDQVERMTLPNGFVPFENSQPRHIDLGVQSPFSVGNVSVA